MWNTGMKTELAKALKEDDRKSIVKLRKDLTKQRSLITYSLSRLSQENDLDNGISIYCDLMDRLTAVDNMFEMMSRYGKIDNRRKF